MSDIEQSQKEGCGFYTFMQDPGFTWHKRGLNGRVALLPVGEEGDLDAPLVGIVWVNAGPADRLRGRHMHPGDAINLVVHGAMYMDGKWLQPGQAKIVPSEQNYGDATPSTDGCMFLEIFENHAAAVPIFDDPKNQEYFNEVHGQYM
jgi:hypothetical protein